MSKLYATSNYVLLFIRNCGTEMGTKLKTDYGTRIKINSSIFQGSVSHNDKGLCPFESYNLFGFNEMQVNL